MTDTEGRSAALGFLTQLVAEGRAVVPPAVTLAILQALAQQQLAGPGTAGTWPRPCTCDHLICSRHD